MVTVSFCHRLVFYLKPDSLCKITHNTDKQYKDNEKNHSDDFDGRLNKHLFHFIFRNRKVNDGTIMLLAGRITQYKSKTERESTSRRDIKRSAECQHNRCRFNSSGLHSMFLLLSDGSLTKWKMSHGKHQHYKTQCISAIHTSTSYTHTHVQRRPVFHCLYAFREKKKKTKIARKRKITIKRTMLFHTQIYGYCSS